MILWSCGGGTQSAAIAALIVSGRLVRPDLAVIVDTEREKSSTWAYLEQTIAPALQQVGVHVYRVPKSKFATVDLYAKNGDLLLPAFTGTGGRLKGFCSSEWKLRVVKRWARSMGVKRCTCWVGFSLDEFERMKDDEDRWFKRSYPLIDARIRRDECCRIVDAAGWPAPPRSACWMCPHMTNREWAELRDHAPADFAQAVALDEDIRKRDPNVYLHRSGRPLAVADLGADDGQQVLGCDSGNCFI